MLRVLGIDQSLNGMGICLLDYGAEGPPLVLETVLVPDGRVGMERVSMIVDRCLAVADQHAPHIIAVEDSAKGMMGRSSSFTQVVEIAGILKWEMHRRGYRLGYGTSTSAAEAEQVAKAMYSGEKLFVIQTSSFIKKFALGDGSTKKDSRYLLTVKEKLGLSFEDDNRADAYMHAMTAALVSAVLGGGVPIGNLPKYQQECLLERARKRARVAKLSLPKALKMTDAEKFELVTKGFR